MTLRQLKENLDERRQELELIELKDAEVNGTETVTQYTHRLMMHQRGADRNRMRKQGRI